MQNEADRALTEQEIAELEQAGCRSADWNGVRVSPDFDPARVAGCVFAGTVKLGSLAGAVEGPDGVRREAGLYRVNLSNVSVGSGCAVSNVRGWLSNLDIGNGVLIENVGTIACTGETSFGNGHEIEVLNEGGGRELKITAKTGAQTAYLTVMYRDRPELVKALDALADRAAAQVRSDRASIGDGASITNCGELLNVLVGSAAVVNGAASLKEGSIDSSEDAPSCVGPAVIAEDFIFQKGSSVTDGAMVAGSLVGEGTRLGKQFSAENSVFFANSEGFHSEACSLFAGPYSVTHHRSTLLIAAFTSFYNAGSGTNQSNHMYKLGPLHQGILERGCKTGSFSYLLWPSRVGAFTAVMGKHYANFDTSDFPFSYIDEENGKSTLIPGMNFFTVGTLRDAAKWRTRDRRKGEPKLDQIAFEWLSPYTARKMMRGSAILAELGEQANRKQEYVRYNGIYIKRLLLKRCRGYYRLALDKYLGDVLVKRLDARGPADLRERLAPDDQAEPPGEWVDVCGLLCSRSRLERLLSRIEDGEIKSLDELQPAWAETLDAYGADEWNWFLGAYRELTGRELADESAEDLRAFLEAWKAASLKLVNMVLNDAGKEFDETARIGFGIDGQREADFDTVRGAIGDNTFVQTLNADAVAVGETFERVVKKIG